MVTFQLVAEDDQAEPKQGPLIAQKLVDAKVDGVVGHFNSGVTIPASRIYNEAGIPELSVSTNVQYTHQGFKTAFRLMADDDKQGKALGEYAVRRSSSSDSRWSTMPPPTARVWPTHSKLR